MTDDAGDSATDVPALAACGERAVALVHELCELVNGGGAPSGQRQYVGGVARVGARHHRRRGVGGRQHDRRELRL